MDSFNSRPHGTNAFLAGAVSASLMWSFASWYKSVWKGDKIQKREDDEKSVELHLHDDDIQKLTKHKEESSPSSLICNPWKAKEAIQYRQLLELRESLIEHSKRTSLLLLDKILSQSQTFIGELPTRKRLRWPWESLRKHLSKENDSGIDGDGVHSSEHAAGKKTSTGGSEESFSSMDENPSIQNVSSDKSHSQQHDEERKEICIGSIFGLDVGGTLSKLVYFEKMRDDPNCAQKDQSSRSMWETFSDESTARRHSSINRDDLSRTNSAEHFRASSAEVFNFHESCSEDDLQSTTYPLHSPCNSPDLAMKRSHSLFDLTSKKAKREKALDRFYEFANRLDTYDTDVKDKSLSFYSRALGGEIHFIQFETRFLPEAMDLIKINDLHLNISKMGATGGGAHKYAGKWEQMLGIEIAKQDELDSLVAGMQFILSDVVGECYTLLPKSNIDTDKVHNEKTRDSNDIDTPQQNCPSVDDDPKDSNHPKPNEEEDKSTSPSTDEQSKEKNKCSDQYWWSRKVKRDFVAKNDSYPYLLVMIGTGVSVLRVDGPRKHERISGSSIGGGTYWGLCRLLTDVEHFDSVLNLAEKGDPSKVDMMVGDIYGKDSNALDKLGLTADIVASSFGKLAAKQDPAAGLKQEDLARALLLMVTNNIGQVAYLNAKLHGTQSIYFVGNFLRHNNISQQRLSYAINYWSRGKMEALFLEHEGYFGALGAFLLHQGISSDKDGNVAQSKTEMNKHVGKKARKRALSF